MEPAALARFGFLTLPSYSMIACANAIEPLRMANRLKGERIYQWRFARRGLERPDAAADRPPGR